MTEINKNNIEKFLGDLAKEIRKEFGRNELVELVLVGGASILLNYGFRSSTMDIDAIKSSLSSINTCIYNVADKYDLPDTWLNYDFKSTASFSDKLRVNSKYYKTYGGSLKVYTVKDEYLIAMKLVAFRENDISDIYNIITTNRDHFSFGKVDQAVINLYGNWDKISDHAKLFIEKLLPDKSIDEIVHEINSEPNYENTDRNWDI